MPGSWLCQRVMRVVLSLSAVALFAAVAIPHDHDQAAHSHPAQSCRACKLQEGFSAAPTATSVIRPVQAHVFSPVLRSKESPRAVPVLEYASPRAPPRLA